ncbi:MAG: hypothetical protein ACKOXZ_12825, partial [Polynucleobacter victoriensis]
MLAIVTPALAALSLSMSILEAGAEYKRYESDLNGIYVRGRNSDRLVPLSSIATVTRAIGP